MAGLAPQKPLLVMAAAPAAGHTIPTVQIAQEMIKRGYQVVFMSSTEFRYEIEKTGAEWYETTSFWPDGALEERATHPPGLPRMLFDVEKIFLASLPDRYASLKALLEMVRRGDQARQVIVVAETFGLAALPFMYGAPLPDGYDTFPHVININVVPLPVTSCATAPFSTGLPPDGSASGRARNKLIDELLQRGPLKQISEPFDRVMTSLGCRDLPDQPVFDTWLASFDTTFQMCSPSLEYPRPDLHPSIRFAGTLPRKPINAQLQYPAWWSDITANAARPVHSAERKKVITVSQGTVATDYRELIIPSIKAVATSADIILIVILGVKGASLPADLEVPSNVRVVDYFPYDAALALSDGVITNAGYGGLVHGVVNGVPMVLAGETEDKTEVAARGEYAGLAVNLKTGRPTSEQILHAVRDILADPRYRAAAARLRQENLDLDCMSIIEREIVRYTSTS